jgi:putative tryptophan/tyrosine transport system substrate-binding protein
VINRRTFLAGSGAVLLAAPLASEAQQAGKVAKIGYLTGSSVGPTLDAFKQALGEHGYIEGRNIAIESRSAEGKVERLSPLATELAHLNVDVFLVTVNRVAVAVREVAPKIPIVMTRAEEPVRLGLVKSLARPGGNITGIAIVAGAEIYGKNLELLKAVLPGRARIAALFNTTSSVNALWLKAAEEAAHKLGVRLVPTGVRSPEDFEQAFALMKQAEATGFVVLGEPLFFGGPNSRRVNDLALRSGLASMWPLRAGVDAGGLMSYGTHVPDAYRSAATYVAKILRGAHPGDLPMEQPTKFELVINLKTAKALGLTIPPSLLQRADEVIQ